MEEQAIVGSEATGKPMEEQAAPLGRDRVLRSRARPEAAVQTAKRAVLTTDASKTAVTAQAAAARKRPRTSTDTPQQDVSMTAVVPTEVPPAERRAVPLGARVLLLPRSCIFEGCSATVVGHDTTGGYECQLVHCERTRVFVSASDVQEVHPEPATQDLSAPEKEAVPATSDSCAAQD